MLYYREETAQSIAMLCNCLKQKEQHVEWLLALPLYHFLNGSCKPFEEPELNPEKIGWGQEENLDIKKIRGELHSSNKGYVRCVDQTCVVMERYTCSLFFFSFLQEYFEKCEHLFSLDPLLLQVLTYICPDKELAFLFGKIPPFLSTVWLAENALKFRGMSQTEVSIYACYKGGTMTLFKYLFFFRLKITQYG